MSTMPLMDWYRHYRQVYLDAAAPKREPHIYTPAHDHRREKLPDPPKCDFVFAGHVTWSGRGESRPFADYKPQPDTAERTRLAVQSIPFALPEKRNG